MNDDGQTVPLIQPKAARDEEASDGPFEQQLEAALSADPFQQMVWWAHEHAARTFDPAKGKEVAFATMFAGLLQARCADELRQALTRAAARSAGSGVTVERMAMGPPVNELDEQIAVFEHGMQQAQTALLTLRAGVREASKEAAQATADGVDAGVVHRRLMVALRALVAPE